MTVVPQSLSSRLRVWRTDLDARTDSIDRSVLSADELARAGRFLHETDRRRYLAARHALRQLLGAIVGRDPAALAFVVDRFGKPRLQGAGTLEFNVSHSAGDCLIAICDGQSVGVDIEVSKRMRDADALARRHFTAAEQAELARCEGDERTRAFLACWTRKEACLKALGIGLSLPPARIEVGCATTPRTVHVTVEDEPRALELASLALDPETVGAIALEARTRT